MNTYEKLMDFLGNREHRKLTNNTYINKEGNEILLRLHGHLIIIYRQDGSYQLNTCGYYTKTTKKRMNDYTPFIIRSKKFDWFVSYRNTLSVSEEIPFEDKMIFRPEGHGFAVITVEGV